MGNNNKNKIQVQVYAFYHHKYALLPCYFESGNLWARPKMLLFSAEVCLQTQIYPADPC